MKTLHLSVVLAFASLSLLSSPAAADTKAPPALDVTERTAEVVKKALEANDAVWGQYVLAKDAEISALNAQVRLLKLDLAQTRQLLAQAQVQAPAAVQASPAPDTSRPDPRLYTSPALRAAYGLAPQPATAAPAPLPATVMIRDASGRLIGSGIGSSAYGPAQIRLNR